MSFGISHGNAIMGTRNLQQHLVPKQLMKGHHHYFVNPSGRPGPPARARHT